ncbi:hypothetical protein AYI69_g2933 [Smittium culicis]|uniref:Uncharacterized protein n=1 Tax=Smittium culicis TaxID=133412 RepID=A0A1R1XEE9_9FUNG|nr:hypothetical protein AYI69_g9184 [Smittium culicis]OMJ27626.1 hypothetical protein AYI69_g2933 [Smittium culicis]
MKFLSLVSALFASVQAKNLLLITNYKTPVLMDYSAVNTTGPVNITLYSTTCQSVGTFVGNVTHYNSAVGWTVETDIGNGYYDLTYYNKNENTYAAAERLYSDPFFKQPITIIEIDACADLK